jgi:hypothetical protein
VQIATVDDDAGNDWTLVAATVTQRPNALAVCKETRFPLAAGQYVWLRVAGGVNPGGGRAVLAGLDSPADVVGQAVSNAANSNAPTVTVPAQPGELIVASWIYGGNITITNATWQVLTAVSNTPVLRALYQPATGTETFTCTAASANAWAINAARLVPAVPRRWPLKVFDGSAWRAMSRA